MAAWRWTACCFGLCLSLGPGNPAWTAPAGRLEPQRRPALAAPERGAPFIRNYSQKEYGGDFQNWSVASDARGVIYVGNNLGVLEYDGVHWRLIRTPGRNVVRSLGADAQGRIYVGAVGEIGYLRPDPDGQTRYVPLEGLLPEKARAFTDVWTTTSTPQGMLFQTREALFLLKDSKFQTVAATTSFHVAFAVRDRAFVRERGVGLMELVQGQLVPVPGGERFKQESIFAMLPLDGGDLLLGSRNLGLWRLAPAGITPFPSEAEPLLKAASIYAGTRLSDGTLALATINGGVVLLDGQGRFKGVLDRTSGLQGDNVKALLAEGRGGLWMALDNGIARVEWPSPFSLLDERQGLRGTVWELHRHQGTLYAATGQGAFALDRRQDDPGGPGTPHDGKTHFHQLPNLPVQCTGFLSVDDSLLLTTGKGVFELAGGQTRPIWPSSSNAISLCRSSFDSKRVFVGFQGGLLSLYRTPAGWKSEGEFPAVRDDIYSIAEGKDGRLWLGTAAQGVLRLTFPPGWADASPRLQPAVERLTTAQGLPSNVAPTVHLLNGELRFATHGGIYLFREDLGQFQQDPRFASLFPQGPRWIKAPTLDGQGRLWMDTRDEARNIHETGIASPQPDGTYRWDAAPFKRFSNTSIEAILVEPGGSVWLSGPEGVLRYDPSVPIASAGTQRPLIRRVASPGEAALSPGQSLSYASNSLRFEFALPAFDLESANLYQVYLKGYDRDWSPWTSEAQKEYTNLPEGRYQFQVRARDSHGVVSEVSEFSFRILTPWYRAWWAYATYLALGGALGFLGVRLRVRLLKTRNQHLEARVALATEALRDREKMLAAQAGELTCLNADLQSLNSRLQEANEQKDRFLGIVVHDLRNPLNVILLSAQMIEESETLEETRRRAEAIASQSSEMSFLIDRFLDIAAFDSGAVKASPETFPLLELMEAVAERHGARARQKGILIKVGMPQGTGSVYADRKFIWSVLDNLVSNAIKFTPSGKSVTLSISEAGAKVVATVADEGPGLTPADKQKLFGRFSKLSARPTGGEKSVGLGLSIAKDMVEAAGGRIWVESEPGQGASFRVELPTGNPSPNLPD